jgi:hypothetical protein
MLNEGKDLTEVLRQLEISQQPDTAGTTSRWNSFGNALGAPGVLCRSRHALTPKRGQYHAPNRKTRCPASR